jgi:hypothetical protein
VYPRPGRRRRRADEDRATDDRDTGRPDVDRLIAAREAEQRGFDDLAAVNQAENTTNSFGARKTSSLTTN